MVLDNTQFELMLKNIEHYVQNFPPVVQMLSIIQINSSTLGYGRFFKNGLSDFLQCSRDL